MTGSVTVAAGTVITPRGPVGPAEVTVTDGRIRALRRCRAPSDGILVPGRIDLQVNGVDDCALWTCDEAGWRHIGARLAAAGVTRWCPTLTTAPRGRYPERMRWLARHIAAGDPDLPRPVGVHLEGPFLGGAPGAHDPDLFGPVDPGWVLGLGAPVAVVTLAPEAPGAVDGTAALTAAGVTVSVGHTAAPPEACAAVAAAGARMVTHCFNGMTRFHHRDPGPAGWALTDRRVAVGVIGDGVHVHPVTLALVFAAAGDRTVLVSDAVPGTGDAVRRPDGTLAGAVTLLDGAVRTAVGAGVPLTAATRASATAPARVLGRPDLGRIEPGARGDLVLLDRDLTVRATWCEGVRIH